MVVHIGNGFLWTCHTVGLSGTNGVYSGDKFGTNVNRSAIQWFQLQINSDETALILNDYGRVFDSVHQTNAWFHLILAIIPRRLLTRQTNGVSGRCRNLRNRMETSTLLNGEPWSPKSSRNPETN
jgi:hypothetical protein